MNDVSRVSEGNATDMCPCPPCSRCDGFAAIPLPLRPACSGLPLLLWMCVSSFLCSSLAVTYSVNQIFAGQPALLLACAVPAPIVSAAGRPQPTWRHTQHPARLVRPGIQPWPSTHLRVHDVTWTGWPCGRLATVWQASHVTDWPMHGQAGYVAGWPMHGQAGHGLVPCGLLQLEGNAPRAVPH